MQHGTFSCVYCYVVRIALRICNVVYFQCICILRRGRTGTMKRLYKIHSKIATLYKTHRICVTLLNVDLGEVNRPDCILSLVFLSKSTLSIHPFELIFISNNGHLPVWLDGTAQAMGFLYFDGFPYNKLHHFPKISELLNKTVKLFCCHFHSWNKLFSFHQNSGLSQPFHSIQCVSSYKVLFWNRQKAHTSINLKYDVSKGSFPWHT